MSSKHKDKLKFSDVKKQVRVLKEGVEEFVENQKTHLSHDERDSIEHELRRLQDYLSIAEHEHGMEQYALLKDVQAIHMSLRTTLSDLRFKYHKTMVHTNKESNLS